MCTRVYAYGGGDRHPGALRANLAAALRQVGAGERLVITVDGRPVAQLGPLEPAAPPPSLTSRRPACSSRRADPSRPNRPMPSTPPSTSASTASSPRSAASDIPRSPQTSATRLTTPSRVPRAREDTVGGGAGGDAVRGHVGAGAAVPARPATGRRGAGDGGRRRVVRVGAGAHRGAAGPAPGVGVGAAAARAVARAAGRVGRVLGRADGRPVHGAGRRDRGDLRRAHRRRDPPGRRRPAARAGPLPHLRAPADPRRRRARLRGDQRSREQPVENGGAVPSREHGFQS